MQKSLCDAGEKLDRSAASAAKMRASGTRRAALRTEASHASRNIVHITWPVGSDGPNKRRDPSDQRPTQKKIQQENTRGVRLVSAQDRRQEIEKHYKQETKHCC